MHLYLNAIGCCVCLFVANPHRFYLFNVSSLSVQIATCIMSNLVDWSVKVSRVVRARKLWGFVYGPKKGREQARLTQSNPYLLHTQYLPHSLEVIAIVIAFVSALLIRSRYNLTLPLDVVVTSFGVQLMLELIWNNAALLFEISLQGFRNRARLYVEHQAEYWYFWAMMKAIIVLPLMSTIWVSIISEVGR